MNLDKLEKTINESFEINLDSLCDDLGNIECLNNINSLIKLIGIVLIGEFDIGNKETVLIL